MKKIPTQRRSANKPLRIAAVLASVGDGLITHDEHGIILSFEGAAQGLFGYAADEVIGSSVQLLMPTGLHSAHDREMKCYLSGGEPQIIGKGYLELPALRKDGTTFRVELAISEIATGARRLFVALVRDITARKQAQAALFAKKERLRVARGSIGDAVITIDVNGNVTGMNAVAEAVTGWDNSDALGRPLASILHLQDPTRADVFAPVSMLLQAPEASHQAKDTVQILRSGERFTIEKSVTRIRDQNGHAIGVVLLFREMSDARQSTSPLALHAA